MASSYSEKVTRIAYPTRQKNENFNYRQSRKITVADHAGNQPAFSFSGKKKSKQNTQLKSQRPRYILIGELRWRRFIGNIDEVELVDDAVRKTMKEDALDDAAFEMSRAVNPCHSKEPSIKKLVNTAGRWPFFA